MNHQKEASLSLDHIKPYFHGGYFIASNLQLLCWSCNSAKGSKWDEVAA